MLNNLLKIPKKKVPNAKTKICSQMKIKNAKSSCKNAKMVTLKKTQI